MVNNIFMVYPSNPTQLGDTLEETAEQLRARFSKANVLTWKDIDIPGRFIADGILEKINETDLVVADITKLSFNVSFEIGYSIGRQKRVFLCMNRALSPDIKKITNLGMFDTIGYFEYTNSTAITSQLQIVSNMSPITFSDVNKNRQSPIYLLDTLYKTDASVRIKSKIKKARIPFRSFDPNEQPRLSTIDAYRNVKESIGVVINLLASNATDHEFNNLRGAFVAGLSYGFEIETLILQDGDEPIPIDYRDIVSVYKHPADVDRYINELAPKITEGLVDAEAIAVPNTEGILPNLDIGAPQAENEMSALGHYYLPTDEYSKTLMGSIRLVVGRKGSGKSALFFQVRDKLRSNKQNVILDLKPEGHQLKRFKSILIPLNEAVVEHVVSAFWEYVLLLEMCHKVLQKDKEAHKHDHTLYEKYIHLAELYSEEQFIEEADFSERMLLLINRIVDEYKGDYSKENLQYLTVPQVTNLIYKHDIPQLRENLLQYLNMKEQVWILFDNLDKGWPTRGIDDIDITILRGLLESTRKIERYFRKKTVQLFSSVFIRNDVYENLVDETPDRGKESRVSIDWTDPDLLREMLRKRFTYKSFPRHLDFYKCWRQICVSHIDGEETSQYLIDRSLMRPRNLLALVGYCKSNAVNLQHKKIMEEDIIKGVNSYSADVVNEIGLEIRDVFPEAEDILYCFIDANSFLKLSDVKAALECLKLDSDTRSRLIEALLWFGFLGISRREGGEVKETYIYDTLYDMKKLKTLADRLEQDNITMVIHKAFHSHLDINSDT